MNEKTDHKGFPFLESYDDFAGVSHDFIIEEERIFVPGHLVTASERDKEIGYEFSAFSPNDPYAALGQVREKIRKGLSIKYIKNSDSGVSLTHNEAAGNIASEGLVINGELITYEQLKDLLTVYEGFNIELKIKHSDED